MPYIRALLRLFLLIIYTFIVVVSASTIINRFAPYKYHSILLMSWYKFVTWLFGFKLEIIGKIPEFDKGRLIVANHSSYLDIMIIGGIIPCHFTPKGNIKKWPIIAQMVNSSQPIYVDRENKRSLTTQNKNVTDYILSGRNLVVFPEGTTNNTLEIKKFKSGGFSFLENNENPKAKDIEILPLTIIYSESGTEKFTGDNPSPIAWFGDATLLPHLWKLLKTKENKAIVTFHKPCKIIDFSSRKELALHIENTIRNCMNEYISRNKV